MKLTDFILQKFPKNPPVKQLAVINDNLTKSPQNLTKRGKIIVFNVV